jgi:hypothetical protein
MKIQNKISGDEATRYAAVCGGDFDGQRVPPFLKK